VHVTAAAPSAAELIATAEDLLDGLAHRWVIVPAPPAALDRDFAAAGWSASTTVYMARRRGPDRHVDLDGVVEVPYEILAPSEERFIAGQPWGGDPAVAVQMIDRNGRTHAAAQERIHAVLRAGGPAAWAKLRGGTGPVRQIEDVAVLPEARGEGLGRAVVSAALEAVDDAGLLFLAADEDDWPKELYGRLGFDPVGRTRTHARLLG
jgi:GNAT superfamily N-acetyltransferase